MTMLDNPIRQCSRSPREGLDALKELIKTLSRIAPAVDFLRGPKRIFCCSAVLLPLRLQLRLLFEPPVLLLPRVRCPDRRRHSDLLRRRPGHSGPDRCSPGHSGPDYCRSGHSYPDCCSPGYPCPDCGSPGHSGPDSQASRSTF